MRAIYVDCSRGIDSLALFRGLLTVCQHKEEVLQEMERLRIPEAKERTLRSVLSLLAKSHLPKAAKIAAGDVFIEIGKAEAVVHKADLAYVHFHEVGSRENVLNVIGSVLVLHDLKAGKVIFSSLNVGSGSVETSHGLLQIPAPATTLLLEKLPHYSRGRGELTTPTGAALASVLADAFGGKPKLGGEKSATGKSGRIRTTVFVGEK